MSRGDDVGAGHVPVLFGPPTFDLDGAASNSEDASGLADHQSPDIDSIGGSSKEGPGRRAQRRQIYRAEETG